MTRTSAPDFLAHLDRESHRFAAALRGTDPAARVPSCPDWDADDLFWHLAEVQWFWAEIVSRRITELAQVEALGEAERPDSADATATFFDSTSARLVAALSERDHADIVWTWSVEQSIGWIRRRMAHETLIHRVDAELAAGDRTPMDPELSADGVDEALRVMYGGAHDWSVFHPDEGRTLRLAASDTGDSWWVSLGRVTGGRPGGTEVDEPDIAIAPADPGGAAAATVTGTAADLDCWLWHRPAIAEPQRDGDHGVVTAFEAVIAQGV